MFKELARQFAPSKRQAFEVRSSKLSRKPVYQTPLLDYRDLSPLEVL